MIFRMLDNLREKPDHVRQQVAFGATTVIMSGIILIWIVTLPDRFQGSIEEKEKSISPFSVLAEQGKVFYDSATDNASSAQNVLYGEILPAAAVLSSGSTTPPVSEEKAVSPDLLGDSPF